MGGRMNESYLVIKVLLYLSALMITTVGMIFIWYELFVLAILHFICGGVWMIAGNTYGGCANE